MAPTEKPTVILGGGLAGLSAGYHLGKKPYIIIEREKEVGGTARSFEVGGFTFDFTGHLLHLHNPYTRKLITRLLKGNFYRCVRNTQIFSKGTYTPYPYQANTFGLPENIVKENITEFVETYANESHQTKPFFEKNFQKWCFRRFGAGIAKNFMIPYNEKLYQTKASKLTTDWCGAFVPMPKLDDVVRGALTPTNIEFGYNQTFLYPATGGIQALPQALARHLQGILTGVAIKSIDWRKRRVTLSNGSIYEYKNLINTIPLPELLKRMKGLPKSIRRAQHKLKYASIMCINVGVNRSKISSASWIYFPEPEFSFYRVGFPMNFTPHAVPKGSSSMYIEVPMKMAEKLSKRKLMQLVRKNLIEARILKPKDKFLVTQFLPIKYAYVIYDYNREKSLKTIFSFLKKNKIQSIGRYGGWKYSFMEAAIQDGQRAAQQFSKNRKTAA